MSDCLLCGSSLRDAAIVNEMARHQTPQRSVECPVCTLVQADPQPKPAVLDAYYRTGEYRRQFPATLQPGVLQGEPGYQASISPGFIAVRAERLVELHRLDSDSLLYEEGCGVGHTAARLIELTSCHAYGADADPAVEARARAIGLLPLGPKSRGHCDLAYALHVMEHDVDPVEFAWLLSLKAKPGGRVHVEVPDVERITGDRSWWFQWPHLVNFSARTLTLALYRAGLDNVHVEPYGPFLAGWGTRGRRMRSYEQAVAHSQIDKLEGA